MNSDPAQRWCPRTIYRHPGLNPACSRRGAMVSEVVDPGTASTNLNLTTAYLYDQSGNLIRKTDADGQVWRYFYDGE